MKTLSKSNGIKKLNKLVASTKNSHPLVGITKNSIAYRVANDLLTGSKSTYMVNGNEIRPVYTSGSGRFCSNQDHTDKIKRVLMSLGIEFEFSNDSKRGGLTGNLITITTKIK